VGCALWAGGSAASESAPRSDDLFREMQEIFAPSELPADLRSVAPEKCATALVREYGERRDLLSAQQRNLLDGYLTGFRLEPSFQYATVHFTFAYEVTGEHAVPSIDIAPANGVPDFVEDVGDWAELSWDRFVGGMGLTAPVSSGSKVAISFREMNAYGYTDASTGGIRLVLHRNFEGFPPNHDPEGSARGAAKVTIAHELRHACQLAMSGWTEGKWLEADAVWAEDRVFDAVDDYLQYLGTGSPISDPASWSKNGAGYEDCLFQHVLGESYGDAMLTEFFQRRAAYGEESVEHSFDAILRAHGSSLAGALGRLALWSYLSGANAMGRPEGFSEADLYPTPPIHAHLTDLPASVSAAISGMGTQYFLASAGDPAERPQLYVSGDAARDYALHAIVLDRAGSRSVLSIPMEQGRSEITEIPKPWSDIAFLAVAVSVVDAGEAPAFTTVNLDVPLAVGVLPPKGQARLELAQNYPNPFRANTTIAFGLSSPSPIRLAIFDASGRLVRTIADESALPAGEHQYFWDGADDRGVRCAPGVYALRLQSPDEIASRKIHLLK
jgi:hypothetical protein